MGAYHYQALKKSGKLCKGIIEADSQRHARDLLRQQSLLPTQVKLVKNKNITQEKDRISAQDLSLFTRQLATLIQSGIPIDEALTGVAEQLDKEKLKRLILGVRSKVVEGFALAEALNYYPLAFPELYRATISAGEQTGHLDLVLEKLAMYTENQEKSKQKIQQALIYPSLMLLISLGIIYFLLLFVVPNIIEVFKDSDEPLPLMTVILVDISHFFMSYGLIFFGSLASCALALYNSLKFPTVKLFWHQIILKLPLIAYLSRSINTARYIHTFSILFTAGVPVLETMRVSSSLLSNLIIRQAFDQAMNRVKEGTSISQSLKETKFLSPMANHLIHSGEKSGQLADLMAKAAAHLDDEIRRLIDTGLTLLEPLVIVLMGGFVLFIVLATLLPIFSMQQLVT